MFGATRPREYPLGNIWLINGWLHHSSPMHAQSAAATCPFARTKTMQKCCETSCLHESHAGRGGGSSTRSRELDGVHATIELEPKLVVCVHSTRKACRRQVYCFTVQVQTKSNRSWKRLRFKHAPCHAAARHEFGENALAPEIEASIWLLLHIDDLVAREPHRVILALQCPTVSGNGVV